MVCPQRSTGADLPGTSTDPSASTSITDIQGIVKKVLGQLLPSLGSPAGDQDVPGHKAVSRVRVYSGGRPEARSAEAPLSVKRIL